MPSNVADRLDKEKLDLRSPGKLAKMINRWVLNEVLRREELEKSPLVSKKPDAR